MNYISGRTPRLLRPMPAGAGKRAPRRALTTLTCQSGFPVLWLRPEWGGAGGRSAAPLLGHSGLTRLRSERRSLDGARSHSGDSAETNVSDHLVSGAPQDRMRIHNPGLGGGGWGAHDDRTHVLEEQVVVVRERGRRRPETNQPHRRPTGNHDTLVVERGQHCIEVT